MAKDLSNASAPTPTLAAEKEKSHYFQKFKVKNIVYLAIMSAVAMVTCAVMPLVVPYLTVIFGIAQLVTGLQECLFVTIGACKVRKPGSVLIVTLCIALLQLAMSTVMFFVTLVCGIVVELLLYFIHAYDSPVKLASIIGLFTPLSLPFNFLYNLWFGSDMMVHVAERSVGLTIGMTFAVLAVSYLGAFLGMKIYKELKKAGAIKN